MYLRSSKRAVFIIIALGNRRHPFSGAVWKNEIVAVVGRAAGVLRNIAPLFARVTRAVVYRAGSQESVARFRSQLAISPTRSCCRDRFFSQQRLALSFSSTSGRIINRYSWQIYIGARKIGVRCKKQSASTGGWESKKREKKRETYRATIVRRSINVCYYASWLFGKLRNRSYPMASYGSLSRDDE